MDDKNIIQQNQEDMQENKIFAVIAYLSVLCIIPLLFKKNNQFVLFHAKQGLVLFIGEVAALIITVVLGEFFGRLSIVAFGAALIFGIIQALMGQCTKIPVVSKIADKIIL